MALLVGAWIALGVTACGTGNGAAGCRLTSVDEASYVSQNVRVLKQLPLFPGSKLVDSYSVGLPAAGRCLPTENGPPYSGFETTLAYRTVKPVPPGAIVRYYRRRLAPKWELRAWTAANPPRDSTFRRGPASLYVVETDRGWLMSVDHAAYRPTKS
jgi:hypothetical protein